MNFDGHIRKERQNVDEDDQLRQSFLCGCGYRSSVARCRVFHLNLGFFEIFRVCFRGLPFLGFFLGFLKVLGFF